MEQTFPCTVCGAPNEAEAGAVRMACVYCGTNLTIPENLRTKAKPVAAYPPKAKPTINLDAEAPDLIRKAQPIAIKAWNLYAVWTWIRWMLPTCLTIFVVGIILCVALGMLPIMFGLFK